MKILVTGGAGFIGSHVTDALIEAGHDVIVVDDLSTGKTENLNSRATFYKVDIRNFHALDQVFAEERIDMVCHQAARMSVQESLREPLLYAQVNVLGSLNLLELGRRRGVQKFIYASTGGAVYGEPRYLPVDENHPINPLDPYGASKHHVEHYLYLYYTNFKIPYTILRYSNVYGPRQSPQGEGGVVAIFTHHMIHGERPIINGNGEQERDFVYVDDVARANLLAIQKENNSIFNLGTGFGTSINSVYEKLCSLMGTPYHPMHGPAKPGEVSKIWLDTTRAKTELGWWPEIGLEAGLRKTIEFFATRRELVANDK